MYKTLEIFLWGQSQTDHTVYFAKSVKTNSIFAFNSFSFSGLMPAIKYAHHMCMHPGRVRSDTTVLIAHISRACRLFISVALTAQ